MCCLLKLSFEFVLEILKLDHLNEQYFSGCCVLEGCSYLWPCVTMWSSSVTIQMSMFQLCVISMQSSWYLHWLTIFWCNSLTSTKRRRKFSYLRLYQQRQPAVLNLALFAFTWKPFLPRKRKRYTSPIFCSVTNTNNCLRSSVWKWRFRCSSRRSFLK